MKRFYISEQLRNGLIAYLEQRPFKEVAQGVSALASLEEAPAEARPENSALGFNALKEPVA